MLAADDPVALGVAEAIRSGDLERLRALLEGHPSLATAGIGQPCGARSLMHVAADWPGHFPNVAETIAVLAAAGADPNARFAGEHAETALHWAASSDDVAALDALVKAGADLEATGAVLGGGTPLADAVGFGCWATARRLVDLGATTRLKDEAALGLMDRVRERFSSGGGPAAGSDELDGALWAAAHAGQREAAEYLVDRGANPNWVGWDDLTPITVAEQEGRAELAEWLRSLS